MTEENQIPEPAGQQIPQETKQCPYCAETILAAAIKCRYCGEFLNRPLKNSSEFSELKGPKDQSCSDENEDLKFSYDTSPSLWAIIGKFFKMVLLSAVFAFLTFWPIRQLLTDFELSGNLIESILKYRTIAGVGMIIVVAVVFLYNVLKLKSVHYHVNPDRIEWSRGIFERRIDNIDMFRVIDLRLKRSIVDCLLGIGTVILVTKDSSDPEFAFAKISRPKKLYDLIKKASIEADTKRGVVHLE